MSTITVCKKNGAVAIAADTLTKWGAIKESAGYIVNHPKILEIDGNYLGAAGPTATKLILRHYFAARGRKVRLRNVDEIFATWVDLHRMLKDEYFLLPEEDEEDSYESSRMDVLIANRYGIFGVGADRAVQEFAKFYAFGYGCEYALGAMFTAYDDPARSAEDVARLGVEAAAEFDDSTGLPIVAYTVRLDA